MHDSWDTSVLTPQWGIVRNTFPTVQNKFTGPGTSLVASLTYTISPTLLNNFVASYVNSNITLVDQNGPGNAVFQRNPTLNQPLVNDPSAPGQCNPALSLDPTSGIPQCAWDTCSITVSVARCRASHSSVPTRSTAAEASRPIPRTCRGATPIPRMPLGDDICKSIGKHTLQFGAQYVLAQRNQTNNAIGAASGDLQGLLTFSNLAHSTGNAFADFLTQTVINGVTSGYIQSFTQDSAQRRYYQTYQIAEPYFQDDWR